MVEDRRRNCRKSPKQMPLRNGQAVLAHLRDDRVAARQQLGVESPFPHDQRLGLARRHVGKEDVARRRAEQRKDESDLDRERRRQVGIELDRDERPHAAPQRQICRQLELSVEPLERRARQIGQADLLQGGDAELHRVGAQPVVHGGGVLHDETDAHEADEIKMSFAGRHVRPRRKGLQRQFAARIREHPDQAESNLDGLNMALFGPALCLGVQIRPPPKA
jgi:hypothetical protein